MSATTTQHAHHDYRMPLWGLFLALLAFTAAEVGLYEIWRQSAADGDPFLPKVVLVLIIFAFTIPKGAIVMIYFMHLKFEKSFLVGLSIAPFIFAAICILTPLVDNTTVAGDMKFRPQEIRGHDPALANHEGEEHGDAAAHEQNAAEQPQPDQTGGSNEDY